MGRVLFLLFVVLPLTDLWLLFRIGDRLGFLGTVGLVIATGAIGAALAKREGARVLAKWQQAMSEGRAPDEGVVSGLMIFAGGLLLVTPGVLTDAFGLLLLVPPVRRGLTRVVQAWGAKKVAEGSLHVHVGTPSAMGGFGGFHADVQGQWPPRPRGPGRADVIDVDGEEIAAPELPSGE